jgi:hypothetical protein
MSPPGCCQILVSRLLSASNNKNILYLAQGARILISYLTNKYNYYSTARLLLALFVLSVPYSASAHHSGALFYSMDKRISLTGEVQSFNFRNPHAIVVLLVTNDKGEVERWTCETSAPSALRRRGWSQQSISPGEIVTLDGVPSRDGSLLMRITAVTKADGTQVGVSGRVDD